jgi:hypothetical protein
LLWRKFLFAPGSGVSIFREQGRDMTSMVEEKAPSNRNLCAGHRTPE